MAEPDLRAVTGDEFGDLLRAVRRGFGEDVPSDEAIEEFRAVIGDGRVYGAFVGDRIVGTSGVFTFTASVPGADPVPCAGVTIITVAADHRRRGLLTRMMRRLTDDSIERGEPLAALYASESPIYGRYGYGLAVPMIDFSWDRRLTSIARPGDGASVVLVDADMAIDVFPAIYDEHRRGRPGMMSRSPDAWTAWLGSDRTEDRDGRSSRYHALLPGRGYATYRLNATWSGDVPEGTVHVEELVGLDADADTALWTFLTNIDLMPHMRVRMRPADDPLPFLVDNHARVKVRGGFPMYVRLVDVPAALMARRYERDGDLVFDVTDRFVEANAGRWRLEVKDGEGRCEPTGADPDLVLDVADLAAGYAGGVAFTRLARAGRVQERTAGAALAATRVFAWDPAPWNVFVF